MFGSKEAYQKFVDETNDYIRKVVAIRTVNNSKDRQLDKDCQNVEYHLGSLLASACWVASEEEWNK